MTQASHHGHNMILNIAKIQADVHTRSNTVTCVATLRESSENICLASQKPHQPHDISAHHANVAEERMHVILSGNEDLVFNNIGLFFDLGNDRRERINNVIN